jgi:uncharacterized protein
MARVVHFEIPADDPKRAVRFYEQALGWQINQWDGPDGPEDYWLAHTGEGMGIDGAIMPRGTYTSTINTVGVESLEQTLAAITAAGGRVLTEIMPIPGMGRIAQCADTEGNVFGVHEPSMPAS